MSEAHRTGLVIRPNDSLDRDLLTAIALATGSTFCEVGRTDVGTVFAAGNEQIISVECAGAKALFLRLRSAPRTTAVIAAVNRHTLTWTESVLRSQLSLETDPYGLVPLLMATGGAVPEPATADLLQRALEHPDSQVREAADYAIRMSKAWTSLFVVS